MTNSHADRRMGCARIAALLLIAISAPDLADEPVNSILKYGDGKEYQTIIQEAHLLGELPVQGGQPYLVFSGRSERPCDSLGCDAETTVFFQRASDPPEWWNGRTAKYPGDYYVKETGKLVARVRMFIGRCIDSREGVAWFTENFEGRDKQARTLLKTGVVFEFVGDEPQGSPLYGLLTTEFPAHQRIAVARKAVSRNVCHEIPPRLRISRPAVDYVGMEMPDVGLMLFGSTPDRHVKQWMKYLITLPPNHPFPIVFFAPEEFKTTGYGNESLIVLPQSDYDRLVNVSRSRPCVKKMPPHFGGGGTILEHRNGVSNECKLTQEDACKFLATISTFPEIHWTADHLKAIQGLSWDTQCKESGWWEYQEKFRQDAEAWAKAHPENEGPKILPAPSQSISPNP